MQLAPVVLFVYNRPRHTLETLNALAANDLAKDSVLYVFSDGPKAHADEQDLKNIHGVRKILRQQQWCKQVHIIESDHNKGLAESIITGVAQVLAKHESVIVLEDDLVTGKGFLSYMNAALSLYEKDERVGCLHGWNYDLDNKDYNESTFFLKGADCWGWATWRTAWNLFNENGSELLQLITEKHLEYAFDRRNTHAFVHMLQEQVEGKNESWAIRWHASLFLKNKYCLHPVKSLVKNIGLDSTGIHCGETNLVQKITDHITLNKIPVKESDWFFEAWKSRVQIKDGQWRKLKKRLRQLLPR